MGHRTGGAIVALVALAVMAYCLHRWRERKAAAAA